MNMCVVSSIMGAYKPPCIISLNAQRQMSVAAKSMSTEEDNIRIKGPHVLNKKAWVAFTRCTVKKNELVPQKDNIVIALEIRLFAKIRRCSIRRKS